MTPSEKIVAAVAEFRRVSGTKPTRITMAQDVMRGLMEEARAGTTKTLDLSPLTFIATNTVTPGTVVVE